MRDWPSVPLAEVCEINPRLPKEGRPPPEGAVSFVPMAAVNEVDGAITAAQIRPYAAVCKGFTPFREGDVLFAKITPCMENGKVALAKNLVGGLGFGSTEFHVLRASSRVLPEWLRYYVWQPSFREQAKRRMAGAVGQQRVPAEFLAQACLPVPPISEQRRLVDLLSRAEGIVRLRRDARKKAAELIPALYLNMFGDPAKNPKGWPDCNQGELLAEPPTLGKMAKPSSKAADWLDLRVANIQEGRLALEDKKWLDLPDSHVNRFALRDGDIVLARAIGSRDHLGKAVVVYPGESRWTFDSHLMRIRLDKTRLLPEMLKGFLESSGGREAFLKHTRRSAVQFNINGKELRLIAMPLTPLSLQLKYLAKVRSIAALQSQQTDASWKAEEAFAALLSRTFAAQPNG